MNKSLFHLVCLLLMMLFIAGCAEFPHYRSVTDGLDRKQYMVVGRVVNSFQQPIVECQVYLTKHWPSQKEKILGLQQHIPVAVTDNDGDFSFVFERNDATEFYLYFDARIQGYKERYIDISHLFTSRLFQYTGNNPVIVNAVLIPDKIEIISD